MREGGRLIGDARVSTDDQNLALQRDALNDRPRNRSERSLSQLPHAMVG